MMYTIRPKNESLISWLLKYGTMQHNAPDRHRSGNDVCICMTKAAHGPLARVCYNGMELHNARQDCERTQACRWFWVPTRYVQPFMHGQEIA